MQLDDSMQDAAWACATDTTADLKPWRQAGVELFPPWFDNSRVRHAGLPRKAAVPPLGPVWPLPPIAGSEFSPSSGSTHLNKTSSIKKRFGGDGVHIQVTPTVRPRCHGQFPLFSASRGLQILYGFQIDLVDLITPRPKKPRFPNSSSTKFRLLRPHCQKSA